MECRLYARKGLPILGLYPMCRLCAQIRAAPDIMLNKFATAKSRLKLDLLALESLIYIYIYLNP